jgi:hypothetical protein
MIFVMLAWHHPLSFAQEGERPKGQILRYGLCEKGPEKKYAQPDSAAGYASLAEMHITEKTDSVPLQQDIGFGFEWRASGLPNHDTLTFSYRVSHPRIVRPDGGVITETTEELPLKVVDGAITSTDCYFLSEPQELVPGDWEIAVSYEGTLLASKRFRVHISGSAGIGKASAADAAPTPLITYPNQVFATSKPGQLGLYIEGEDWHLLLDMPGFEHVKDPFITPSHFLFMRDPGSGTTASVFAERINNANSAESCGKHYASLVQQARDRMAKALRDKGSVSEVSEIEAHGKTLQVFESTIPEFGPKKAPYWRKAIHWFPHYRGFCFHLHFDVSSGAAEQDVLKILDSLAYVPQKPRDVDIGRFFYFADRLLLRLSIPIDWRFAFRPPPPGPAGGIELQSAEDQTFSFLIIPLGRTRSAAHSDQPEGVAEEERESFEAQGRTVSPLRNVCSSNTCVYYFDLTVRGEDSSSYSPEVRYHRQAWAKVGDMVLGLSLLYRDSSKDAAEHITAALTQAKVLDLRSRAISRDDDKTEK